MDERIIPIEYEDDPPRRLKSLDELRQQIDAFFRTFDGDYTNLYYTDDPADTLNYGDANDIWYSAPWHNWQDGLYLATLRAIAEGVDDPKAWAAEAVRLYAADFTRWYE